MLFDIWDLGLINVLLYLIVDNAVRIINIQQKLLLDDGKSFKLFSYIFLIIIIKIEIYKILPLMKITYIPPVKQLQQVQVVDKIDEHNVR